MGSYLRQPNVQCYQLTQLRSVSLRSVEGRDHYLVKTISYIGKRVASQTDEITWRFQ